MFVSPETYLHFHRWHWLPGPDRLWWPWSNVHQRLLTEINSVQLTINHDIHIKLPKWSWITSNDYMHNFSKFSTVRPRRMLSLCSGKTKYLEVKTLVDWNMNATTDIFWTQSCLPEMTGVLCKSNFIWHSFFHERFLFHHITVTGIAKFCPEIIFTFSW